MDSNNHFLGPLYLIASGSMIILAAFLWRSLPITVPETPSARVITPTAMVDIITVEEAASIGPKDSVVFIDIRPEIAYLASHIPGAINLPADQDQAADYSLNAGHTYILYGDQENITDSLLVAQKLITGGISDVKILSGGLKAWIDAGNPVQ